MPEKLTVPVTLKGIWRQSSRLHSIHTISFVILRTTKCLSNKLVRAGYRGFITKKLFLPDIFEEKKPCGFVVSICLSTFNAIEWGAKFCLFDMEWVNFHFEIRCKIQILSYLQMRNITVFSLRYISWRLVARAKWVRILWKSFTYHLPKYNNLKKDNSKSHFSSTELYFI